LQQRRTHAARSAVNQDALVSRNLCGPMQHLFYKARGPILPTPWHQDTPFLRVRGDELIRVWIPCDHSPRELTVQVLRGSHRWNVVYSASAAGKTDTYNADPGKGANYQNVGDPTLPPPPDVNRYRDSFDILTWTVEPGDALAFQGNMVHGADGHPGWDKPRRALAALMGGPDLRYHAPKGKAFPVPGDRDERIPDGAPIGGYPRAFPVCWIESSR
jgi:ectoine hydroxylase-related dioxygenase (phytanoyl-CoA dioxygenase family)